MPIDYSKYPENWKTEIRPSILMRAGGSEDAPAFGARCEFCGAQNYKSHPETGSKVILTIAHLEDPDPMNCDPSNLAALCQKCHNTYDAERRAANRRESARQAEIEAGQMELFSSGTQTDHDPGALTFEKFKQAKDELEALRPDTLVDAILVCERLPVPDYLLYLTDPIDEKVYCITSRAGFNKFLQQIPADWELKPGDQGYEFFSPTSQTRRIIPLYIHIVENADEQARALIKRVADQTLINNLNIRFD